MTKLERLERWRPYFASPKFQPDRAWLARLWSSESKFWWYLRTRRDALLKAGAIVQMAERDLLIDPPVFHDFVSVEMGLVDELKAAEAQT